MNERGQIFTLDMFFALTLTVLVVSYSGLALEGARRQAESYALRYSLERTVNDAADVLVKTLGRPSNWAVNAETLETPGFAEENEGNPVQNTISVMKFGQLRRLTNSDNWVAPVNANAVEAIKKLFGGSENFEIRILDENGDELWHAFPGWVTGDVGEKSGAENSFEVAVVRRSVAVRYGTAIRVDSGMRVRAEAGRWEENLEFEIYPGELDAFDWYIIVRGGGKIEVKIFVNRMPDGGHDYHFAFAHVPEEIYPNPGLPALRFEHGGVENDKRIPSEYQLDEGANFLGLKFDSKPRGGWIRVYVVMVPACSDWDSAPLMLETLPATLEVKLWR